MTNTAKIQETRRQVRDVRSSTLSVGALDPLRAEVERPRAENGELRLYVATLFRILEEKGIVTRWEVEDLVERIDAEGGERDNAYTGDALP